MIPTDERRSHPRRRAARRDRGRLARPAPPAGRHRERRHDRDRRDRPVRRARGPLRRARGLAARRRRLRRVRLPHRARAAALAGMELADSITLDPHKWLYQPIELGALLVRDGAVLRRGFEIYARLPRRRRGASTTRSTSPTSACSSPAACRALKLWMSLRYFGAGRVPPGDRRCLDLAAARAARIDAAPELELMSPASLGMLTFRRHPSGVDDEAALERINASLADQIEHQGDVFVSTAVCAGARAAPLHPQPLDDAGRGRPRARAGRDAAGRPRPPGRDGAGRGVSADRAGLAAAARARRRRRSASCRCSPRSTTSRPSACCAPRTSTTPRPGEAIVEQWQVSRELYVVLDGMVEVTADGQLLDDARPRASSSASWPRSTGAPASAGPGRRPSRHASRRGCSCSAGCSSTA